MKNSNDTIGNRTRDLPTCSAVPQPTALPRALTLHVENYDLYSVSYVHEAGSHMKKRSQAEETVKQCAAAM